MDVQTLIEGGTISIALVVLYLSHQERKDYRKIITNHINHNTETQTELKDAIRELINWLKKNGR